MCLCRKSKKGLYGLMLVRGTRTLEWLIFVGDEVLITVWILDLVQKWFCLVKHNGRSVISEKFHGNCESPWCFWVNLTGAPKN